MEPIDDETVDIELRSPAAVAVRCLVLGAVLRRVASERAYPDGDRGAAAEEAFDERAWLDVEGLSSRSTDTEAALLVKPVGQLTPDEVASLSWQGEALVALGWCLGAVASLPPAEPGEPQRLLQELPGPWDKTLPWIASRRLRPEDEIARARDVAEIWHWRATLEPARRLAKGPDRVEMDRAISEVTEEALHSGLLRPGNRGGFLVGGVEMAALAPDTLDQAIAVTTERLTALNWVCGFGDTWDNVPLEV